MEDKINKKLGEFLEAEYHLIADPEETLKEAVMVLEFFTEHLKEEEPYAVNEINALDTALDFLYSQQ